MSNESNGSASAIKNTADLRKMLLDTIADVRSGACDPKLARTVAALSTTISHSAKLDLDVLRFHVAHKDTEVASGQVLQLIAG